MVKKRRPVMRTGDLFSSYTQVLRRELEPIHKRRITDRELTDSIADFLDKENLTPIMLRRAKRKPKKWRGLF